jgi:hypothetical protein
VHEFRLQLAAEPVDETVAALGILRDQRGDGFQILGAPAGRDRRREHQRQSQTGAIFRGRRRFLCRERGLPGAVRSLTIAAKDCVDRGREWLESRLLRFVDFLALFVALLSVV